MIWHQQARAAVAISSSGTNTAVDACRASSGARRFFGRLRADRTLYKYGDLSINSDERMRFDDVRAAKMAVEQARTLGLDRWLGASLASPA